ncbi:MAG TPA: SgcJ/EcaC family oxidoreductase [Gemmata sp.]|nr:SgcJ/EcaC family oxidoreductase [Gemmata sp.]
MISTRRMGTVILLIGCVAAAGWLGLGLGHAETAGDNRNASPPQSPSAPADRPGDRDGVQKAIDEFAAAFHKGDATAVANMWTAEGEYISDDGTTFRGREALEKAYAEFFTKNPHNSLAVEVESIRFPSRENAVVEGHFKLRKGKKEELIVSKCSFLYAREDGKWLIAIAREWPGDGLSIRDLEWLIGTWEAKQNGINVTTTYEWTANKSFIRCHFSISKDGEKSAGMQMFGKDPSSGELHQWTFEDSGGLGNADISRDGKKWLISATGVTADGRILSATNIMTPIDGDTFIWQSVERTLDGEALPDLPPIKVSRVKGK